MSQKSFVDSRYCRLTFARQHYSDNITHYRMFRARALVTWRDGTGLPQAASLSRAATPSGTLSLISQTTWQSLSHENHVHEKH
jgi:hypothetical protein